MLVRNFHVLFTFILLLIINIIATMHCYLGIIVTSTAQADFTLPTSHVRLEKACVISDVTPLAGKVGATLPFHGRMLRSSDQFSQ
ncbi:hypothetical protein E2C01_085616 [Portunus trituberculatus]|uniref:Uncharacterized protein n=1 Tax=Portunus trituberculatus TaxID=210409 RepID=A0A5B7J1I0_PORTR|nr:hypothetical protein [Portunus trituberculatus]